MSGAVSIAPDGVAWRIPSAEERAEEWVALARRASGRRVVVVQGLGFVGAAVATAIAAARDGSGRPEYFVIGVDLPSPGAWWKAASLASGVSPFACADPDFRALLDEAANRTRNLCTTACPEAYGIADVIVVDVQLDVASDLGGRDGEVRVDLGHYEEAVRAVGRHMKPGSLVVVETTVPLGMTRGVIRPILEGERAARGITEPLLLAHAYERVMPGPKYLDSIRNFWRVYSADDPASLDAAGGFIASFTDTRTRPATALGDTVAGEMAKLLENSYRAANIAFIHEWTLLAERAGVNLWEVVDAIRVRRGTHDNMRYPGFGVGGYCLTKDSYLAEWGARHLLGIDGGLPVTLSALATNHSMPGHTLDLLRECAGGSLAGLRVLLCGVSYLAGVPDTRNSPAIVFCDAAVAGGAVVSFHDPLVAEWCERPGIRREASLEGWSSRYDAVVFAVPHPCYAGLAAGDFRQGMILIDASNILDDARAGAFRGAGCLLAGAGKGHWRKKGWHIHP